MTTGNAAVANGDSDKKADSSGDETITGRTKPPTVIEWSVLQQQVESNGEEEQQRFYQYQFQPLILTIENDGDVNDDDNEQKEVFALGTAETPTATSTEEPNNDEADVTTVKSESLITTTATLETKDESNKIDDAPFIVSSAQTCTTETEIGQAPVNEEDEKIASVITTDGTTAVDMTVSVTATITEEAYPVLFKAHYWDPQPSTRCPGFWRCPVMASEQLSNEEPPDTVTATVPCWAVDIVDTRTIRAAKARKQPLKKSNSDKKKGTNKEQDDDRNADLSEALPAYGDNIPRIPDSVAFRNAQNAFQKRLSYEANGLLPTLLWQAILEECQAAWFLATTNVDNDQQQPRQQSRSMPTSKEFRYYSQNPNQYLPSVTTTNNSLTPVPATTTGFSFPVSFTPSALLQRVKQGCALAWQEEFSGIQQQQQQQALASSSMLRRTSARRVTQQPQQDQSQNSGIGSTVLSSSSTYIDERRLLKAKPGGRVALLLLEKTNHGDDTQNKTANGSKYNHDDDHDEDEQDNDDDEKALVIENPFLKPARKALLEWLGRKMSKSWSTTDIQPFFARDFVYHHRIVDGKKKRTVLTAPSLETKGIEPLQLLREKSDRLVWSQMLLKHKSPNNQMLLDLPDDEWISDKSMHPLYSVSEFLFTPRIEVENTQKPRIVVQCVGYTGEVDDSNPEDIGDWELATFGRTQFTVRLFYDSAEQKLRQHHFQQAEVNMQKQKKCRLWETYRYKGIHSGFCQWGVNWIEAAVSSETMKDLDKSVISTESMNEVDNVDANADFALAKSLATDDSKEEFFSSGQRRKTRRTGESGGVFYGNQSNMTQKQLMDSLLRLISSNQLFPGTKPFQTLIGLLQGTPEESSDPMRRIRLALGRLLWKRNQVSCLHVSVELSDKKIWSALQKGPLWILPQQKGNDTMKIDDGVTEETKEILQDGKQRLEDDLLVQYIRTLHQTELILRSLVMDCMTEVPISVIATAADEKSGSMESMDQAYFDGQSNIQWRVSGHELLDSEILRPPTIHGTEESAPCIWYRVTDFCPTVISEEDGSGGEQVSIGRAKEPPLAERRIRFRAVAMEGNLNGESSLILTEAQVRAGILAAEKDRISRMTEMTENPYASSINAELLLIPEMDVGEPITGIVAGHESVTDSRNRIIHKVLVLPKRGNNFKECFWFTLDYSSSTSCTIDGDSRKFIIQQFDYTSNSQAYQECLAIVKFLERHPKASVFQEPVDPIALGIPDYPTIIKNPMDVSTLKMKLERGDYSDIPPSFMRGANPVARMLNGPFRSDIELIFDNAMLFNPPDDWIHQAASSIKKSVLKKIEQATSTSENKMDSRKRKSKSIYVDYDSDVDLYVYESDEDDEYGTSRSKRKRKGAPQAPPKEDASSRPIERSIRLQRVMSESTGLRHPFANIPISSDASQFSLPLEWKCKYAQNHSGDEEEKRRSTYSDAEELDELIALHRQAMEADHMGLRRSTRASDGQDIGGVSSIGRMDELIYFIPGHEKLIGAPRNRLEIEQTREMLHENFYAKSFQDKVSDFIASTDNSLNWGSFSDGSFPPYLGRVVPSHSPYQPGSHCVWEIRDQYIIPALRWIIRGLINSEHLKELEPLEFSTLSGVVIPNHIYYIDESKQPYDILDAKDLTRRKRTNEADGNSSASEVELSEYEKAREERVARNRERLKALGLA